MIEIVEFNRGKSSIKIGYRQNNAVVYASVPSTFDDTTAKQKGYEQVRKALEYESTINEPSIDGKNMITIERFTPAAQTVVKVSIKGDRLVTFADNTPTQTRSYTVVAYDQYNEVYSTSTLEQTFNNETYQTFIKTVVEGVEGRLRVNVYQYVEPTHEPTLEERTDIHEAVLEEMIFEIIPIIGGGI